MSGPRRLAHGGAAIDRARPLGFSFDGEAYRGYAGDTLASALLANGVQLTARSFKYHRPRGIVGFGAEEPNTVLDLRHGARHEPNARATLERLEEGMQLRAVHALGSARWDGLAFLDAFARFIPAAFYYKSFMWPNWLLYEPMIRAMAGLGRLDPAARCGPALHRHLETDVCVIGAGAAGLAAAQAALARGQRVLLVEQQDEPGGALLWRDARVEELPGAQWAAGTVTALQRAGATVLLRTTAVGLYDHNAVVLVQRLPEAECLWRVRACEIVLATGAVERPLLFADNDRPGVMLADATLAYLRRYAVRCGERALIATTNDSAYAVANALCEAGAQCVVVDSRTDSPAMQRARESGIPVHADTRVQRALGRRRVEGALLDSGACLGTDLIAVSGGWTPLIHLYCHARGKPRWDAARGALLPGTDVPGLRVVGAAAGEGEWGGAPLLPLGEGRVWVDLQHDVTTRDIALAVRENFVAVEHLKRYTTLGMANDQGKTSNINGLAVLAAHTGREIGEVGVTTFRPPFVPVSFATVAGTQRGELLAPLRRLPAESAHRADDAWWRDYGNLLRPAWYGREESAIERECRVARSGVVVFDASSLGKIEVLGPDAAALLDFVYYTRMSTLAAGRLRYGLALAESGAIWDDGVVLRLSSEHFVVSCSSSHVAAMRAHLEEWREDRFDPKRVFVHDATAQWATIAISGPAARRVMAALDLGVALEDAAFPHMSGREGRFEGRAVRIARVSFTGERCYEISVPAGLAVSLWQRARAAGAVPLGVEALGVLRAEKGFIFVGQDTDSETMPQDIGMGQAREARTDPYVGDRSLFTPAAQRPGRRHLVGIATHHEPLAVGAHAVVTEGRRRSIGFVTSSHASTTLGRPVALALIVDGQRRLGEWLEFEHLGECRQGMVVAPCAYDPQGARLRV